MPGLIQRVFSRGSLAIQMEEEAKRLRENPKIVVLREPENDLKRLASSLFLDEDLVVFVVDPERRILFLPELIELSKRVYVVICETREEDRERYIKRRVVSYLRAQNKIITDKAYEILKERITDESVLENELVKLVNYVGERREIRSKDVLDVVSDYSDENLISLFDALRTQDRKEIIKVLCELTENLDSPNVLLGYLVRLLRLLLQAKELREIVNETEFYEGFKRLRGYFGNVSQDRKNYFPNLNPKYASAIFDLAKLISPLRLYSLFLSLIATDVKFKSGTKLERERLESIVTGIISV